MLGSIMQKFEANLRRPMTLRHFTNFGNLTWNDPFQYFSDAFFSSSVE